MNKYFYEVCTKTGGALWKNGLCVFISDKAQMEKVLSFIEAEMPEVRWRNGDMSSAWNGWRDEWINVERKAIRVVMRELSVMRVGDQLSAAEERSTMKKGDEMIFVTAEEFMEMDEEKWIPIFSDKAEGGRSYFYDGYRNYYAEVIHAPGRRIQGFAILTDDPDKRRRWGRSWGGIGFRAVCKSKEDDYGWVRDASDTDTSWRFVGIYVGEVEEEPKYPGVDAVGDFTLVGKPFKATWEHGEPWHREEGEEFWACEIKGTFAEGSLVMWDNGDEADATDEEGVKKISGRTSLCTVEIITENNLNDIGEEHIGDWRRIGGQWWHHCGVMISEEVANKILTDEVEEKRRGKAEALKKLEEIDGGRGKEVFDLLNSLVEEI